MQGTVANERQMNTLRLIGLKRVFSFNEKQQRRSGVMRLQQKPHLCTPIRISTFFQAPVDFKITRSLACGTGRENKMMTCLSDMHTRREGKAFTVAGYHHALAQPPTQLQGGNTEGRPTCIYAVFGCTLTWLSKCGPTCHLDCDPSDQ